MTKLIVALDVKDREQALEIVGEVGEFVDGFKVGLQLLMAEGTALVREVSSYGKPIFADAKLHDIPNTVEKAASVVGTAGATWLSVHLTGGVEMVRAAVRAAAESSDGRCGILGITRLTSDPIATDVARQVLEMSAIAEQAGCVGVVSAVAEVAAIQAAFPNLVTVCPGIRLDQDSSDDQRRVATPAQAFKSGAGFIVVGRSITASPDPVHRARLIRAQISSASIGSG